MNPEIEAKYLSDHTAARLYLLTGYPTRLFACEKGGQPLDAKKGYGIIEDWDLSNGRGSFAE